MLDARTRGRTVRPDREPSAYQRLATALLKAGIDEGDRDFFASRRCDPWFGLLASSQDEIDALRDRALRMIGERRQGRAA